MLNDYENQENLTEAADVLLSMMIDAEAMSEAVSKRLEELKNRKADYERTVDKYRQKLRDLVILNREQTGEVNLKTTVGDVISLKAAPQAVIITNEQELPVDYVVIKQTPDKRKIAESLKAGLAVPGAMLSNGGETIQIRG